jgi:hypothetical protein
MGIIPANINFNVSRVKSVSANLTMNKAGNAK